MLSRIKQTAGLVILVGASALAGCATQVPTTSEWAISNGYQRAELQGKEYFCRQQPAVTGSNQSKATCFSQGNSWQPGGADPPSPRGSPTRCLRRRKARRWKAPLPQQHRC